MYPQYTIDPHPTAFPWQCNDKSDGHDWVRTLSHLPKTSIAYGPCVLTDLLLTAHCKVVSLEEDQHCTMWKVILVTGGNKGIGLAIVEALLQEVENSVVLLGSRDAVRGQEAVDGVVAKLGKQFQPRLQPVLIDVTSQESVDKAAAVVKKDHGKIYGVINNAGGSFTGLRATIDLNSYGVLRVCEAFAPLIEDGGRIVQVSLNSLKKDRSLIYNIQVSSAAGPSFVGKCTLEMQKFCIDPEVTWKEVGQFS